MRLDEALLVAVQTDRGLLRANNEDSIFVDAAQGLAILADGMGGYNGGEVASNMTTTLLAANLGAVIPACFSEEMGSAPQESVRQHILNQVASTNYAVFSTAVNDPRLLGMGTTLLLVWLYDNRMSVAHIGDSRLYRLRDKTFQQLTRDHTLLQEQLDNGMITAEEAQYVVQRSLLTRALGVEPEVEVEIHDYDVSEGDILLLCSDGLYDMVDDEGIAMTLRAFGDNLAGGAAHLVEMANQAGGRDNISVVLIKIKGDFSMASGWWRKLLAGNR